MKNKTIVLLGLMFFVVFNFHFATVHAQGTAFTYQGRLNDANGPANGSYDISFTAYAVAMGGVSTGARVNPAVLVTNGLFTTVVDFGANPDGAPIWFELAVRTNGTDTFTVLSPREQATPTPYAMFANTASNLVGNVTAAQLPLSVVTNGASGVTVSGTFAGNGAAVVNVNATALNGLNNSNFWQLGGNTVQSNVDFIGSVNDAPVDFFVNNHRMLRLDSHDNVLGGSRFNQVQHSTIYGDPISATVAGGGAYNIPNIVSAPFATVSGGAANTASGAGAVVGGGGVNGSNIGANSAEAPASVVAGGFNNHAAGSYSTVSGGNGNATTGIGATVPGGFLNAAAADYSFAAGYRAQAITLGTFVWADTQDFNFTATANNQFLIRASGGVGIGTNAPAAALHVHQSDVTAPAGLFVNPGGAGYTAGTAVRGLAANGSSADLHPGGTVFPGGGEFAGANGVVGATVNNGSSLGNGVVGLSANANGNGVYGAALNTTGANAGVSGRSYSTNGSGVYAENVSGTGAALTIGQGAIRVAGAGEQTQTAVFTLTVTNDYNYYPDPTYGGKYYLHIYKDAFGNYTNSTRYAGIISNSLCDGDPNAILFVTPKANTSANPSGLSYKFEYLPDYVSGYFTFTSDEDGYPIYPGTTNYYVRAYDTGIIPNEHGNPFSVFYCYTNSELAYYNTNMRNHWIVTYPPLSQVVQVQYKTMNTSSGLFGLQTNFDFGYIYITNMVQTFPYSVNVTIIKP